MTRKPGLVSKATSAVALLIGLTDVIVQYQANSGDPKAVLHNIAHDYSAGFADGNFDSNAALRAYGPLVGAVGFKKAMSFLTKRFRF